MGAALAANTGAAGARHRVGFFAAEAAPTGTAHVLTQALSTLRGAMKYIHTSARKYIAGIMVNNTA